MRAMHRRAGAPTAAPPRLASTARRRLLLGLLATATLLAWQLAKPEPSQAQPGSLDLAFGSGGKVATDLAGGHDQINDLVVQADGKLVAAGTTTFPFGTNNFALARYTHDGRLDLGFGQDGKVTTDFGSGFDEASALAVQADGRVVAAGLGSFTGSGYDFALARYSRNGSLDAGFGTGGKTTTDFAGDSDQANALVIQADGKLVAAGTARIPPGPDFGLARYNRNGTLDASFGAGGKVTTDFVGRGDEANAVAIQADGKPVAAGQSFNGSDYDFALARYEPQ